MKSQRLLPIKNIKSKKVLLLSAFLLLFALCLGIAHIISALVIPTSTQVNANLSTPTFKIYFISLSKSQLENSAYSLASDYQKLGAGGYVWKNQDYYHIIASCYEKENDAILVQNNIKLNLNLDSEIFSVEFTPLSYAGDYEQEQKKVLAKSLKTFYITYQSLFDIAISLDTNVYNDISARLAVNSTYSALNAVVTDYNTIFANTQVQPLQILGHHLSQAGSILENLCSGKPVNQGQTYSSLIKYRYTQLLASYHQFLLSF